DQLLGAVASIYQPMAQAKSIELRVDIGDGATSTRLGDRTKVTRILSQLLNNALKFTQVGAVILSAQRLGRDDDGLMRMTVSDTGIGMSHTELEAVLSGQPSPAGRGAGLGLLLAPTLAK